MKHCYKCNTTKAIEEFTKNSSKSDGLGSVCLMCNRLHAKRYTKNPQSQSNQYKAWYSRNKGAKNALTAKYKAQKIKATPSWADLEAITAFYSAYPEGYHVDHIVPLRGKNVCGLHTINNLQYLLAVDNIKKGNKHV